MKEYWIDIPTRKGQWFYKHTNENLKMQKKLRVSFKGKE